MAIFSQSKTFVIESVGIDPNGRNAELAVLTDGRFIVSFNSALKWGDQTVDVDAFAQRFDASGVATQFIDIDPDNPGQSDMPSYLVDVGDGYVAFVRESADKTVGSVTLVDGAGLVLGTAFVGADLANFDKITSVTRLANGNVVIAGVYLDVVSLHMSDSTLTGAPAGIPGVPGPVDFGTLTNVALRGAVDVMVTGLNPGSFAPDPMLETYSAWGAKQGNTSISVAISLNGVRLGYDVLALKDGTFVVAWTTKATNGMDVMAGYFDSNGVALVVQGNAPAGDQSDPRLALGANGKVLVPFTDLGNNLINGVIEPLHMVALTIRSASGGFLASAGVDVLNKTGGHDGIDGLAVNDVMRGLGGHDVLFGGGGNDRLFGGIGNDILDGGDGNDGLAGGAGSDVLKGGAGRDALSGGQQADLLQGGADNDRLDGGAGNDTLTGNSGADVFVFRHDGGSDTITDFTVADVLRLDRTLWEDSGDLNAAQVLAQFARGVDGDTVLNFANGETITLVGFAALVTGDLQFI